MIFPHNLPHPNKLRLNFDGGLPDSKCSNRAGHQKVQFSPPPGPRGPYKLFLPTNNLNP